MRFFAATFSLILSAALAAAQATPPLLNTPDGVAECFNTQLTWSGGTGPYQIQVLPGDQPMATPLEDLGVLTGTTFTWLCRQTAGTRVFLRLRDTATGQISSTATITVGTGDPTRCAAVGSSSGAPAPTSGAATPSASASAPVASTPAGTTTPATTAATPSGGNTGTSRPASSNTARTSSGAASSPSSTQPGGAGQLKAPVALAVGAALAMAVFA